MSLFLPERVVAALEPGSAGASGAAPWLSALALFEDAATGWRAKRLRVKLVLSSHFLRYLALEPGHGARDETEALALARCRFAAIHGEAAAGWEVRLCTRTGLACAVDVALLRALAACFPASGRARLESVQPVLACAYSCWRRRLPREGAWIGVAEPGVAVLGALTRGGWQCVRRERFAGDAVDWGALVARERARIGPPLPATLLAWQGPVRACPDSTPAEIRLVP